MSENLSPKRPDYPLSSDQQASMRAAKEAEIAGRERQLAAELRAKHRPVLNIHQRDIER